MIVSQPSSQTFNLAPGEALTVQADAVSNGTVFRLGNSVGDTSQGATAIGASTTIVFGPYTVATRFQVVPSVGSLAATQACTNFSSLFPATDVNSTPYATIRVAHAKYDFAVDGGVQSTITPSNSENIPDNAILIGATINSPTAVTSGGSATVAIGTSAGSSTTSIKAATAKASYSADAVLNGVPVFATPVKMTAAGQITFTIGTADLTAGVIEVWVLYVVANS